MKKTILMVPMVVGYLETLFSEVKGTNMSDSLDWYLQKIAWSFTQS